MWPQDAAAGCILRRQASWGVARESGQMVHAHERLCGWTLREEARGRGAVPDWVGARWEENCSAESSSAVGTRGLRRRASERVGVRTGRGANDGTSVAEEGGRRRASRHGTGQSVRQRRMRTRAQRRVLARRARKGTRAGSRGSRRSRSPGRSLRQTCVASVLRGLPCVGCRALAAVPSLEAWILLGGDCGQEERRASREPAMRGSAGPSRRSKSASARAPRLAVPDSEAAVDCCSCLALPRPASLAG